ncbi:AraC family transcriptional regulator [Microbacterium sp. No. 7]|uniref:AraC family transcriptional regulator n=1 Tax=Microbacterium sp. No. 7 TaxID=1714373 RepID=UPI0006D00DDF|nr:helix-turn-helix domain-containing protein [Microbacterium sp. No. 7]ALJ19099.1 hypothetical protein AOA12_03940 [Microbacterium sp. No. 7]
MSTKDAFAPKIATYASFTGRVGGRLHGDAHGGIASSSFVGLAIGDIDVFRFTAQDETLRLSQSFSADTHLLLIRSEDERMIVSREGRASLHVPDGDVAQVLVSDGIAVHLPPAGTATGVVIPADAISEFRRLTSNPVRKVVSNHELVKPIWGFLDTLLLVSPPWPNLSGYFIENLLNAMLTSIIVTGATHGLPTDETNRIAAPRQLVQQARNHLVAYSRDPRLTSQSIADDLGVSLRSLQRAFSSTGSTLAKEIRLARGMAAVSLLQSPEGQLLSLDEIARLSGYPDAIALRRAFHKLGFAQPSSYRFSTPAAHAGRHEVAV